MGDQLYYACFNDKELVELLELLYPNGSGECFAVLEKVPKFYFDKQERQDGIQLVTYNKSIDVGNWTRGRVFNNEGELRWELDNNNYMVVYAGNAKEAAERMNKYEQELIPGQPHAYHLWGDLLEEGDRQKLGLESGSAFYLESIIPRIFLYPLAAEQKKRLVIRLVSYEDARTAMPQYFRFHSIEEVS